MTHLAGPRNRYAGICAEGDSVRECGQTASYKGVELRNVLDEQQTTSVTAYHKAMRIWRVFMLVAVVAFSRAANAAPRRQRRSRHHIVHVYPHDPAAFTQGLEYHDGFLYEGTDLRGDPPCGRWKSSRVRFFRRLNSILGIFRRGRHRAGSANLRINLARTGASFTTGPHSSRPAILIIRAKGGAWRTTDTGSS